MRFLQWKQAQEATETLLRTPRHRPRALSVLPALLGLAPDANPVPDTFPLDRRELTEENFDEAYQALVGRIRQKRRRHRPTRGWRSQAAHRRRRSQVPRGPAALFERRTRTADLNAHGPARTRASTLRAVNRHSVRRRSRAHPRLQVDLHFWGVGATRRFSAAPCLPRRAAFISSVLNIPADGRRGQA